MGSHSSHETYQSTNSHEDGYHYMAMFETNPFSEGESRYAFNGKYKGRGPMDGEPCVTKEFKKEYAKHFDKWQPDLAASTKAKMFAEHFNTNHLLKLDPSYSKRKLEFVIPPIAKIEKLSQFNLLWFIPLIGSQDKRYIKPDAYVAIEPYFCGTYVKFDSNGGYEDQNLRTVLPPFTHWTWKVSGHKYMICDLQGVICDDKYKLTDPVVHSADRSFGDTDVGIVGMNLVLAHYKCNSICEALGLQNPMKHSSTSGVRKSTTYAFQLTEEQNLKNKIYAQICQIFLSEGITCTPVRFIASCTSISMLI